eukprot:scaffold4711_cov153-Pinguiococcus_pyrenoidosus.AAC.1
MLGRNVVLVSPPVPGAQKSGLLGGMDITIVEGGSPLRTVEPSDKIQPTDIVLIAHEWNADGPTEWAACPCMGALDFVLNGEELYDSEWKNSGKHRGWNEKRHGQTMKIYKSLTLHQAMIAVMACKNFYRIDCSLILEAVGLANEKLPSEDAKMFFQVHLSSFQKRLREEISELSDLAEWKTEHEQQVRRSGSMTPSELGDSIAEKFRSCIPRLTRPEVPLDVEETGDLGFNEGMLQAGDDPDQGDLMNIQQGPSDAIENEDGHARQPTTST